MSEPASTLTHQQWMRLATEEYRRIDALLAALSPSQWAAPTDCSQWCVRDIVAHLIGAAEATASLREQLRQQRWGGRNRGDGTQLDAVNRLQVEERHELSTSELRRQLADAAIRGVRARSSMPALLRALRFPSPPPVGWISLGFLNGTVYTRDAWMHRVDICRATGLPFELTADHDGSIIADAARAWLCATGVPGLVLTGPVGRTVGSPGADEALVFDAVEFARALSGRAQLSGVSADVVLF